MTTTINADDGVISGSAGLKSTPDSSGELALQTNGVTALTVDASQNVEVNGTVTATSFLGDLSGNATTVTNGLYTNVVQINTAKKAFEASNSGMERLQEV